MRFLLSGILLLTTAAVSQTAAQTGGSAQANTNISAGQSGASATNQTNVGAQQNVSNAGQQNQASVAAGGDSATSASVPVPVTLNKSVESKKAKQGDEVTAKTLTDIGSNSQGVIPKGSKILGRVVDAKARSKGDSESSLSIVFDRAELKDGTTLQLQSTIQAIAAPVRNQLPQDDSFGAGGGSAGASGGASGGSSAGATGGAGGVGGTVGSTVGAAGGTVGGVAAPVGSTVAGAGSAVGGTLGSNIDLTPTSTGVIGIKDLQLASAASNQTGASVISSTGKNVKLESGSQMILRLTGVSRTNATEQK